MKYLFLIPFFFLPQLLIANENETFRPCRCETDGYSYPRVVLIQSSESEDKGVWSSPRAYYSGTFETYWQHCLALITKLEELNVCSKPNEL